MLTEAYREKNVQRVLDGALALGEEIGIAAVNKSNLARRVGLSTKSVQRYFANKTDLVFQVSQRILDRNDLEIREILKNEKLSTRTGLGQLECFLTVHNEYVLKRYQDVVFLQSADLYCRYSGELPDRYWTHFRTSEHLEKTIALFMERGVADGSMASGAAVQRSARTLAVLCAGLVERLSTDIDCRVLSIDEALEISRCWIENTLQLLEK